MVYDYPDPPRREEREPICPVCGSECCTVFRDRYFEIVGATSV